MTTISQKTDYVLKYLREKGFYLSIAIATTEIEIRSIQTRERVGHLSGLELMKRKTREEMIAYVEMMLNYGNG
jgi:hypothetical protein